MLRALELPGLIAANESAYVAAAAAFAADSAARAGWRSQLRSALDAGPLFVDSLAAGDAFGALLEAAYDELAALDRPAFRAEPEPLRCFSAENLAEGLEAGFAAQAAGDTATAAFESQLALRADPAHPRVRYLRAHALVGEGKVSRAVDYLMAALPHFVGDKEFWFFLAQTLRQNRQAPEAIQALESCLRLDGQQVEPLLMMIELAEGVGAPDIAREALQCLQAIAPDDHRVLAMS
jgi:predicted O-linked N-acetylglucosamine transferase (SPINDLY family)